MGQEINRFVECKNACGNLTIWLPHSTRLGTSVGPPRSSTDLKPILLACPQCDYVYEYSQPDFGTRYGRLPDPYRQGQLSLATIGFECDGENCGVPVQIHRPVDASNIDGQWRETVTRWELRAQCQKWHQLTHIPSDYEVWFESW